MSARGVDILMYHSISDGEGPTCIVPATFREQMTVLAECGYRAVSLAEFVRWWEAGISPLERVVVLTFDDGFADFASVAFPELQGRGWTATVFLPAAKVGGTDDWQPRGSRHRPRPLMTWPTVKALADAGVDFGAHGLTHSDLTGLAPERARAEIEGSRRLIESHTGRPVTTFAPPFGRTDRFLTREIARCYRASVGTTMGRAAADADVFDLPRVEMWYFRDPRRWQTYLVRGTSGYFRLRQVLRRVRAALHPLHQLR